MELGVVLERNKVKVAVIQESKLSPKSKNSCIRNHTTVHKDRPHGHGRGLLTFIHISITFSKQPSSPETLYDPHLEELSIKAELGNTKLIICNIYRIKTSITATSRERRLVPIETKRKLLEIARTFTVYLIMKAIKRCTNSKAFGPDKLGSRAIEYITSLFNLSVTTCHILAI